MLKVLSAMVAVLQAHELKSTLNLVPFSRAVVPNLVPLCSKDTRGCWKSSAPWSLLTLARSLLTISRSLLTLARSLLTHGRRPPGKYLALGDFRQTWQ
jgi:hypothetical protein